MIVQSMVSEIEFKGLMALPTLATHPACSATTSDPLCGATNDDSGCVLFSVLLQFGLYGGVQCGNDEAEDAE